jgi:hypothetical protein
MINYIATVFCQDHDNILRDGKDSSVTKLLHLLHQTACAS